MTDRSSALATKHSPPPRVSAGTGGICDLCGKPYFGNSCSSCRTAMTRTNAFSWLRGGNDRKLAATRYAGRQSATARAKGKTAWSTARDLLGGRS